MKAEQNSRWGATAPSSCVPPRFCFSVWPSQFLLLQEQTWNEDLNTGSWFRRRFQEALTRAEEWARERKEAKKECVSTQSCGPGNWIPLGRGCQGRAPRFPPWFTGWGLLPVFLELIACHWQNQDLGFQEASQARKCKGWQWMACRASCIGQCEGHGSNSSYHFWVHCCREEWASILLTHLSCGHWPLALSWLWTEADSPQSIEMPWEILSPSLAEDRQLIIHQPLSSANNSLLGNL